MRFHTARRGTLFAIISSAFWATIVVAVIVAAFTIIGYEFRFLMCQPVFILFILFVFILVFLFRLCSSLIGMEIENLLSKRG